MGSTRHWSCAHASDVWTGLSVVEIQLCTHPNFHRMLKIGSANCCLESLSPTFALLQLLSLFRGSLQHFYSSLVESCKPNAVTEIGKTAPQIHARGGFPNAITRSAKSTFIDSSVARQT